jgi:hypothetical protein
MFEAIIASVAGSAASSILGGGSSRSQKLPAKFDRTPAPIPEQGRERYATRHPRPGKITRRIRFIWYNSNTYQSSRGDA